MSNHTYSRVICDKCGVFSEPLGEASVRNARKQAKTDGWKLGKQKDFCPNCFKEIQKKIKELQACAL